MIDSVSTERQMPTLGFPLTSHHGGICILAVRLTVTNVRNTDGFALGSISTSNQALPGSASVDSPTLATSQLVVQCLVGENSSPPFRLVRRLSRRDRCSGRRKAEGLPHAIAAVRTWDVPWPHARTLPAIRGSWLDPASVGTLAILREINELVRSVRKPRRPEKSTGTGGRPRPDSSKSAIVASHWFWCIESRAIRNDNRSRTPESTDNS